MEALSFLGIFPRLLSEIVTGLLTLEMGGMVSGLLTPEMGVWCLGFVC